MKHCIANVFSCALALGLVACGGGDSGSGSTGTPGMPPPSNPPPSNPPPSSGSSDVTTYKYDLNRSGWNSTETTLTPANVASSTFGKLRTLATDNRVDAAPLYLSQLSIGGTMHNVLYVATENDTVYAFDADTGTTLWQVSLLNGEHASDTRGCGQVTPQIGITSTPVIDRTAGAIYVVAMTLDNSTNYHQRLHALSITTGAELANSPRDITATFGATSFDPGQYEERAALLLVNGTIYTSWTSHCDSPPYGGWIIAFNQSSLAQTAALNVAPGASGSGYANQGPAIWMAGGGPGADAAGNVYLLTGNGRFETTLSGGFPSGGDYGNSFLKLSLSGNTLSVADYFTMSNEVSESQADTDLGSGGEMLLPDMTDANGTTRHLVLGAGKDSNLYIVDRDSMGKFDSGQNHIWQELDGALPGGIWSTPAYANGVVYYGPAGSKLRAFTVTSAKLSLAATSQSSASFPYPGSSPSVSSNGAMNGIVWAYGNSSPAVLYAYDAADLSHELYDSSQAAGSRDQFGSSNKFMTPVVANGKVFLATPTGVAIFGLL